MHIRATQHGRLLVTKDRYPILPETPWMVLRAHHQPDERWWETLHLAGSHAGAWAWLDRRAAMLAEDAAGEA